jgi:sensor histidine kinase regulating citrate/malate metabolism
MSIKDDALNIIVSDDGNGLASGIDVSRIFDLSYSGTQGSGIGLYHIKSVLTQLNGSVKLLKTSSNEAKFLVEIKDED